MANFSFYKACTMLNEAPLGGPTPPMGGGGMGGGESDPAGGMGGGMPIGGDLGGAPPMGGGLPGGDPMGGGAPPATPIPIQTIPIADVWKVLKRVVDDTQYDSFFNEINVSHKNPKLNKVDKSNLPKSLLK